MAQKVKVSRFGSANNAPSSSSGKYMLFALAAVVLLLVGFTVGKTFSSSKTRIKIETANKESIGQAVSKYGPTKKSGIVPVGFQHSTKGAITAATAYVGLVPRLYVLNDGPYQVSVTQIAMPDFASDLASAINVNRVQAQEVFTQDPDALFREYPLGNTVTDETKDSVTVQIWSLVLLAAKPNYNGNAQAKIHTIELAWSDNDWKIQSWTTADGPMPKLEAPDSSIVSVDEFLKDVSPFTGGYNYVPGF